MAIVSDIATVIPAAIPTIIADAMMCYDADISTMENYQVMSRHSVSGSTRGYNLYPANSPIHLTQHYKSPHTRNSPVHKS